MNRRSEARGVGEILRGLLTCALCGRPGGHLLAGSRICTRCRNDYAPTRLAFWRWATGTSVAELSRRTRVTQMTIHRALRGEAMGKRAADAIARVTGIDRDLLMEGQPSPFGRKRECDSLSDSSAVNAARR